LHGTSLFLASIAIVDIILGLSVLNREDLRTNTSGSPAREGVWPMVQYLQENQAGSAPDRFAVL